MRIEIMFEIMPYKTVKFVTGDCHTIAEANEELISMLQDHQELFVGDDASAKCNLQIFKRFFGKDWVEINKIVV